MTSTLHADREPDPDQVERERPRRDAELARPLVPVHELPEEEPRRAERDRVERHEQRVAEEADAERDERERGERDRARARGGRARRAAGPPTTPADRRTELRRASPAPAKREQDRADTRVAEPGDPVAARPREEQDGETDAGDRGPELREPDHPCTRTSGGRSVPVLGHDEPVRARRRRRAQAEELAAMRAVRAGRASTCSASRAVLTCTVNRLPAATVSRAGRELDVADDDRHVLALRGGSLVAGEVPRADREDVRSGGQRLCLRAFRPT